MTHPRLFKPFVTTHVRQSVGRSPDSQKAYHWIAAFAAMTNVNSYNLSLNKPIILSFFRKTFFHHSPVALGAFAGAKILRR
jgi:hypothetical protein